MPWWNPFTRNEPEDVLDPAVDDPVLSTTTPGPLVSQQGDADARDGGPHPLAPDMGSASWIHVSEMRNIGEAGLDPNLFPDGEIQAPQESATAHAYQSLRARTVPYVLSTCTALVQAVQEAAAHVARDRDHLDAADAQLLAVQAEQNTLREEVHANVVDRMIAAAQRGDGREWQVAAAVLGIFLIVETFLNGEMFSGAMRFVPYDFVPYVVSFGLMAILVAVSHLSAVCTREGLRGVKRPNGSAFDAMFAWGQLGLGLALFTLGVVAAFPLAEARAIETRGDLELWTLLYILVQVGIHLSVFVWEFMHGSRAVSALAIADDQVTEQWQARDGAHDQLLVSEVALQHAAVELAELPVLAKSLDIQLVESYRMTIEHGRHVLTVQDPDLAGVVALSPRPELDQSAHEGLVKALEDHLHRLLGDDAVDAVLAGGDGSVARIRHWFLTACGGLDTHYRRPDELLASRRHPDEESDHAEADTPDESATTEPGDDSRADAPRGSEAQTTDDVENVRATRTAPVPADAHRGVNGVAPAAQPEDR